MRLLLLFLLPLAALAQQEHPLWNQKVEASIDEESQIGLGENIYFFVGDVLDSTDIEIMSDGPIIGTLLVRSLNEGGELTYGLLYAQMCEIKAAGGAEYAWMKELHRGFKRIYPLPATAENWEQLKALLSELESPEKLAYYDEQIPPLLNGEYSLAEALIPLYTAWEELESARSQATRSTFFTLLKPQEVLDLEALQKRSRLEHKPLLIYFTGHNCVNARKYEEYLLSDPSISPFLIEDFIFFAAYADENTPLPKELQRTEKLEGRPFKIETIGDHHLFAQMNEFDVSSQPFLVFMDAQGTVLETADFEQEHTVEALREVIDSALEQFVQH